MPRRQVSWQCETCRKTFTYHDEARNCEVSHVVAQSVDRTTKRIADAFDRLPARIPANLQTGAKP